MSYHISCICQEFIVRLLVATFQLLDTDDSNGIDMEELRKLTFAFGKRHDEVVKNAHMGSKAQKSLPGIKLPRRS